MEPSEETTESPQKNNALGCAVALAVFIIVAWACLCFSPFGRFVRSYGEAEDVVNELVIPFRYEIIDGVEAGSLLERPEYSGLKKRAIPPDLETGEVARFHINEMFEIGVTPDGMIRWHQD